MSATEKCSQCGAPTLYGKYRFISFWCWVGLHNWGGIACPGEGFPQERRCDHCGTTQTRKESHIVYGPWSKP